MSVGPEEFCREAMERGLSERDLDPNPVKQFQSWYTAALGTGLPESNAMTLCTVDECGQPFARTVLLKLYDERGFVFFTNYESRKAGQIAGNPRVALLFPWAALGRQIQIRGRADRIPTFESLRYFVTRPRGSQIGAWSSPQSQVITSRSVLEVKVAEMQRKFANGKVPLPDFWGGFRVVPETFEYWQGRASRLHDRFEYRRDAGGSWHFVRLAP